MTDEEIAKVANEKANEKYPIPRVWCEVELARNCGYERGFIDGVKYGCNKSNEWHDLRKNPNDLPPLEGKNVSINILTDDGIIAYYSYGCRMWYDFNNDCLSSPKAWCEIPQFEECDVNNEM